MYLTWSGRFSANLLDGIVSSLTPRVAALVPAIGLAAWWVALTATLYQISLSKQPKNNALGSLFFSTALIFVTLQITPKVNASLYWGQGMRAYVPPIILGTAYIGLTFYNRANNFGGRHTWFWLILSACLAFVAGGFNEGYVLMQTASLGLMFVVGWLIQDTHLRKRWFSWILVGLLSSTLALAIIILAPGNSYRQAYYPPPPGVLKMLLISLISMLKAIGRAMLQAPGNLNLALLLLISMFFGSGEIIDFPAKMPSQDRLRQALIWIPLGIIIILFVYFVPAAYGMSQGPPGRARIIPLYILVLGIASWGYCLGYLATQTGLSAKIWQAQKPKITIILWSVVVLFTFSNLWSTVRLFQMRVTFVNFAQAWEARDSAIWEAKARGDSLITVPDIQSPLDIDEPTSDPGYWINQCMREYYGIAIKTSPSASQSPE
jgi:hypothetical protein